MVSQRLSMSRILVYPVITIIAIFQAVAATGPNLALPIVFEPNAGRWDPHVKFSARTDNYRVFLTAQGAELSASQHAISISVLNANPLAEVSGADKLRCQTSYFLGNHKENWRTGIPNY